VLPLLAGEVGIIERFEQIVEGKPVEESPFDDPFVAKARDAVCGALGVHPPQAWAKTGLQSQIFRGCHSKGDPDSALAGWIDEGAPFGILNPISRSGIFPPAPEPSPDLDELPSLNSDWAGWTNYVSAETEPETVTTILDGMVDAGWADRFATLEAAKRALGCQDLVCNRLALISKLRLDKTTKHRLVWDFRRSGVNRFVRQGERIVLPTLSHIVEDIRALVALAPEAEFTAGLCADVEDAFHQIPLAPDERRFALACVGGVIYAFKVLVFGSASAPTVWGRFAAFLGRTWAAIVDPSTMRVQIFVDDPFFTVRGSRRAIALEMALAMLWAAILGFPLAWHKVAFGASLPWIGAQVSFTETSVTIAIQTKKVEEILETLLKVEGWTYVGRKLLRSLAGKLSFVAGLVPPVRVFLDPIWAALAALEPSAHEHVARSVRRKRDHTIPVKRFSHALAWLIAFFSGKRGKLERTFDYLPRPPTGPEVVTVCVDASPWGIGGFLAVGGAPQRWFADPITDADLLRLRARRGVSDFNTLWEALAVLVAVQLWAPLRGRWAVWVRSDSLATLLALRSLKARSTALNILVREFALLVAELDLELVALTHVPGVANGWADALSRLSAPVPSRSPTGLLDLPRDRCPGRGPSFWRALTPRAPPLARPPGRRASSRSPPLGGGRLSACARSRLGLHSPRRP